MAYRVGDGEQDPGVGAGNSPGGSVKASDSSTASSRRARRPGSTRRILAAAVSPAVRHRHPRAAAGDQAEQHGQRLVVAQHERGQPVAGGEPVAAVPAAHRLDGHVEVDQMVHVPPYGASLDAEPVGELGHRAGAARLEQFEEGEHAAGGSGMIRA